MKLIYQSPIDLKYKTISFHNSDCDLKDLVFQSENLTSDQFDLFLSCNGKPYDSTHDHHEDVHLQLSLRLRGGKGGFGSMLRALGAQIQKTTNREACRDLSGRRLRDVNEEKRIKEYIKRQADRKNKETQKKKDKLKKLAEMKAPGNCEYNDDDFEKAREEIPEIIEESIAYALKQGEKRKLEDVNQPSTSKSTGTNESMQAKKKKRSALWLGVDLDSDDSSDDSQESDSESKSAVKSGVQAKNEHVKIKKQKVIASKR